MTQYPYAPGRIIQVSATTPIQQQIVTIGSAGGTGGTGGGAGYGTGGGNHPNQGQYGGGGGAGIACATSTISGIGGYYSTPPIKRMESGMVCRPPRILRRRHGWAAVSNMKKVAATSTLGMTLSADDGVYTIYPYVFATGLAVGWADTNTGPAPLDKPSAAWRKTYKNAYDQYYHEITGFNRPRR